MTENEAIKGLEILKNQCKHYGKCGTCEICYGAVPLAIKALEEIQQYRAIGTVEDFKNSKVIADERYDYLFDEIELLRAYASIGTIEEFKALKEKNEPKKPNGIERKRDEHGFIYQIGKCPCCGKLVTDDRECCDCMQKFDWRE